MADAMSDGEKQLLKPPPKRRRILDPSAIVPVPVYSSKVSSGLQMKPKATVFSQDDVSDDSLWSEFSRREPANVIGLSDSEDEAVSTPTEGTARCPSPPPPESPVQKQSRKVKQKLSEIDRKLQAVNALRSPEATGRTTRGATGRTSRSRRTAASEEDDVVVVSPPSEGLSPGGSAVREIPLKIRCRTDVHKIPVLTSMCLSAVVTKLSVILDVPPPRLLLLREDVELDTDATVAELGLGIADIIECVIMRAEDQDGGTGGGGMITVRLQSKDKDSSQEFSVHREAPLGSVFSQYAAQLPDGARRKIRFHFDGHKVTERQTPAQLDMEDGDIIEVWT
ncbi:NFATC2-interacting protein isoform X2 [Salarias fasciatus]|uniref:NFATC2-interacting protein isoform X2 n=1 Tax=Salarias fasciatus TaxID=181472 RepID=UPI0011769A57|nr:NFATC2-interacting protein isoform X2 [Salarias fasciatus]